MCDFKLPNNVEVKEIHNAVSITPKSIYSSTLGYITSFRETYINPILKIESPKPTHTPSDSGSGSSFFGRGKNKEV